MSIVYSKLKEFVSQAGQFPKLFKSHSPGQRVLPANVAKHNKSLQLRIDAGDVRDGKKTLFLQANAEATSKAIKDFISKNGTHANIGTVQVDVDTPESKYKEESERIMAEFEVQYRAKIG